MPRGQQALNERLNIVNKIFEQICKGNGVEEVVHCYAVVMTNFNYTVESIKLV